MTRDIAEHLSSSDKIVVMKEKRINHLITYQYLLYSRMMFCVGPKITFLQGSVGKFSLLFNTYRVNLLIFLKKWLLFQIRIRRKACSDSPNNENRVMCLLTHRSCCALRCLYAWFFLFICIHNCAFSLLLSAYVFLRWKIPFLYLKYAARSTYSLLWIIIMGIFRWNLICMQEINK